MFESQIKSLYKLFDIQFTAIKCGLEGCENQQ